MIPLHLHLEGCLLDVVAPVSDIVTFAQAVNLPTRAPTDSNALYGAMECVDECRNCSIVPSQGAELD